MQILFDYLYGSRVKPGMTLATTFILFLLILIIPQPAFAESLSFKVSPTLIKIKSQPGEYIKTPLTIQNLDKNPLKLKVLIRSWSSPFDSELRTNCQDDKENWIPHQVRDDKEIMFTSDENEKVEEVELAPLQTKTLNLNIDLSKIKTTSNVASAMSNVASAMSNVANTPKDYYFSILFISQYSTSEVCRRRNTTSEVNNKDVVAKFNEVKLAVGLNVLVSVGKKPEVKPILEAFEAPFFVTKPPVPFKVVVKNTGVNYVSPKGVIYITNMFGQTVGKIDLAQTNILQKTSREILGISSNIPTWNEDFILGLYTAKLKIVFPENGLFYEKSIYFLALPIEYLASSVILMAIILLIIRRVRKYLQ